jgi:spore coat protein A
VSGQGLSIPRFFAFLILAVMVQPRPSLSDQITLPAVQDNVIYSESNLSYGAGQCLQVGRPGLSTPRQPLIRRSLLLFDLSSIPAGSNIVSARLNLFRFLPGGPGNRLYVHRVSQDWGEGNEGDSSECTARPKQWGRPPTETASTWRYRFFGARTVWSSESGDTVRGGSFESSFSDSGSLPSWMQAVGLEGSGIARDVAGWVQDPASNHGWILRGDETLAGTGMRFASRQHPDTSLHPTLTVSFSRPAGACCVPDGTCALLTHDECDAQAGTYGGDNSTCAELVCLEPYVDDLPIPPVAVPVRGKAGGAAFYDIAMREFRQKLHHDLPPTTLWGYDGRYPGPTIESQRNQPVQVRWINDLRDFETGLPRTTHYFEVDTRMCGPDAEGNAPRTVVHLHGAHVPSDSDGFPESTFVSGSSRLYRYPNTQLPTTLWYHDHALGITRYNVMMGLAGLYIIRGREEEALQLPPGPYDIPLLIQDRSFHPDGSLRYPALWEAKPFLGDKVLVNGMVWPKLSVDRGTYRFRVVNGSNHRIFTLALSDHRTFHVIGSDGGLLSSPVEVHEIALGPAERADLVIDFGDDAPGSEVLLTDTLGAGQMDPTDPAASRIMKFVVSGTTGWTAPLPLSLDRVERMPESQATRTRTFEIRFDQSLQKFRFGDLGWGEATEFPALGTTEIWQFANETTEEHPIHMHLTEFQILDRSSFQIVDGQVVPGSDRRPPDPEEAGWKDTARVKPHELLRIIMRFGPDGFLGDYVLHCHMLEHEDNDMMRQFTVVPPKGPKPQVASARAEPSRLWPPDLAMAPVNITGVSDFAGDPVSIHVTRVTQDEPMPREGVDRPCSDAEVIQGQLYLRRERLDGGNGRVYRVFFTAVTRGGGVAEGSVVVGVPREAGVRLVGDDGQAYNSLAGCPVAGGHMDMAMKDPRASGETYRTSLKPPRVEGGRAVLEYTLAQPGEVSLAIYSVTGRLVASLGLAAREAGVHRASIPLEHVAHGIYFVRMRAAGISYTRRMPVLRRAN